ncbi:MAG: DNA polymerase [Proteobacteria bacterium]|nr:DNA polymerase [Pseudomonadota bacterium]
MDFEFGVQPGERPEPVCLVARELRSGELIRVWQDELYRLDRPPYGTGPEDLFVAYFASAELGCHRVLGWPMPERILDLYVEHKAQYNGVPAPAGYGLLGALTANGLESIGALEKQEMRALVLRGGPWAESEQNAILGYCQTDVDALARLLPIMAERIDLPRALLRGRYMAAVAAMEHIGVPVDLPLLEELRGRWDELKIGLVEKIDADYRIYEGTTFKLDRFIDYLTRSNIAWPRLPSGRLSLSDEAFRDRGRAHPQLGPLRGLRHALSQMRLHELAVGHDGRNRVLLSPFGSRSGRNTPSNSKFIFGSSAWLRGLIRPPPGHGLAYVDWSSQEIGIAAALSGDLRLIDAYQSGDPYLTFAKQIGAAPSDATKASHKTVRDQFKAVVLGVNYGMAENTLADSIGQPVAAARDLLRRHRETYRRFWWWAESAVDLAMSQGEIQTIFGWPLRVGMEPNPRTLLNFPMQANAAEMMRLACCLATERGIQVCAPVHDAMLICAPLDRLEADIDAMRAAMAEASRVVLDGFELGTDAEVIRSPDRYEDPRGAVMWATVMGLLEDERRVVA